MGQPPLSTAAQPSLSPESGVPAAVEASGVKRKLDEPRYSSFAPKLPALAAVASGLTVWRPQLTMVDWEDLDALAELARSAEFHAQKLGTLRGIQPLLSTHKMVYIEYEEPEAAQRAAKLPHTWRAPRDGSYKGCWSCEQARSRRLFNMLVHPVLYERWETARQTQGKKQEDADREHSARDTERRAGAKQSSGNAECLWLTFGVDGLLELDTVVAETKSLLRDLGLDDDEALRHLDMNPPKSQNPDGSSWYLGLPIRGNLEVVKVFPFTRFKGCLVSVRVGERRLMKGGRNKASALSK